MDHTTIAAAVTSAAAKKTKGRQKLEMKKIGKKITFSKRRKGLFRKAGELSVLSGSEIAILVQSPAGKIFAFGTPTADAVLCRLKGVEYQDQSAFERAEAMRLRYEEAVRKLEAEMSAKAEDDGGSWWERDFEGMDVAELEEYAAALESLRNGVLKTVMDHTTIAAAVTSVAAKKTKGRQKLEMKKIGKKPNLQATFSKRRKGLFRKAGELSALSDSDIAILVQSPAGKIFAFGTSTVDAVLGRLQGVEYQYQLAFERAAAMNLRYEEAVRKLEAEKSAKAEDDGGSWWERDFEGMDVAELEVYAAALESLRNGVLKTAMDHTTIVAAVTSAAAKKTKGRRKLEMKKIGKKPNLQVTFSKRRKGLFRKAGELSVLSGSEIAILVQSPAGKIFAFGAPTVDAVVCRLQGVDCQYQPAFERAEAMRLRYEEAVRKLEAEKSAKAEDDGGSWWERDFEGMDVAELEVYAAALESLRNGVLKTVEDLGCVAAQDFG
ncbi:MADS-box transcription factor family protein, partial [Striga asiatica]